MIKEVFGATPQSRLMEPPVDDLMGRFKEVHMPVGKTPMAALWSTNETEYFQPQTQNEHNDLLNKYWPYRETMPNWKELGQIAEREDPKLSDDDAAFRKNFNAKSSLVEGVTYDPNSNLVNVKMGGKEYTYAATPDQLKRFMSAGSLGREINQINKGRGTSLQRTASKHISTNSIFGGGL